MRRARNLEQDIMYKKANQYLLSFVDFVSKKKNLSHMLPWGEEPSGGRVEKGTGTDRDWTGSLRLIFTAND